MHTAATEPRQLTRVKPDKTQRYLQVANVLLNRFQTHSSERSIRFLVDLVQNRDPGMPPPVPWVTNPSREDEIQVGVPALADRILPAMNFEVRFARRR